MTDVSKAYRWWRSLEPSDKYLYRYKLGFKGSRLNNVLNAWETAGKPWNARK
jgi:hypothetical protein